MDKKISNNMSKGRFEVMTIACHLRQESKLDWDEISDKIKKDRLEVKKEDILLGINDAKIKLVKREEIEGFLDEMKEEMDSWDRFFAESKEN